MSTHESSAVSARWALIDGAWHENVRFALAGGYIESVETIAPDQAEHQERTCTVGPASPSSAWTCPP